MRWDMASVCLRKEGGLSVRRLVVVVVTNLVYNKLTLIEVGALRTKTFISSQGWIGKGTESGVFGFTERNEQKKHCR